jgi:Domain of unknown function (DUF1840)
MYRFKSKADADLIMMTPVGDQILRLIGREPAPQGIIEVDAIGAAITALEQAIASAEAERGRAPDDDDERGGNVAVGLAQRAWPMVEMMRRSLAERAAIVWGV